MSPRFLNCLTVLSLYKISSYMFKCPCRIGHPQNYCVGSLLLCTAALLRVIGEQQLFGRLAPQGEAITLLVAILGVEIFSVVLDLQISFSRVISVLFQEKTSSMRLCGSPSFTEIPLSFLLKTFSSPSSSRYFDINILLSMSQGPGLCFSETLSSLYCFITTSSYLFCFLSLYLMTLRNSKMDENSLCSILSFKFENSLFTISYSFGSRIILFYLYII